MKCFAIKKLFEIEGNFHHYFYLLKHKHCINA